MLANELAWRSEEEARAALLHIWAVMQECLDKAIKTMRETGADMSVRYKETARGGLALNVVEC